MPVSLVGERGQVTIPKDIRTRLGILPRSAVILEEKDGTLVIRPAATVPVRIFSDDFVRELARENALRDGDLDLIRSKWKL